MAANFVFLAHSAGAAAETRSLKLYFLHTKERGNITYKVNGKYIDSGLRKINHLLRDWRRDEPTKMDPRLLDLLWEVYRDSGSHDYIHVISAYRSPATNSMLRKRSKGVAKNSQHMLGRAMDFFLPDVKLSKLREVGLKAGAGGVGYYPTSGSPFVHMDTGSVRHWPRMSRQELARVFPNGNTLHVPSDGKPLPGYERAVAKYKAQRSAPPKVEIVSADEVKKPNFFERWAKLVQDQQREPNEDEEEDSIAVADGSSTAGGSASGGSGEQQAASAEFQTADGSEFTVPDNVPVPLRRPGLETSGFALAAAGDTLPAGQDAVAVPAARLATLTPGEIEDMRRSAIAADLGPLAVVPKRRTVSADAIEDRLAPAGVEELNLPDDRSLAFAAADGGLRGPRPAEIIPDANSDAPVLRTTIRSTDADSDSNFALRATPVPAADLRTTGAVPLPRDRPRYGPSAKTLELALAPTDPDNSAREAISMLIDASSRLNGAAASRAAARDIVAVDADDQTDPAQTARWHRRPSSSASTTLDGLAMGGSYVGQWALVSQRSLVEIGELQAPIYGRHATVGNRNAMAIDGFVKIAATYRTGNLIKR